MKQTMMCITLIAFMGIQSAPAQKKEFKEIIKKQLSYKNTGNDRMLEVQNLNGSITIEGYDGDVVLVEVHKTITASNTNDLELGKKEIGVKVLHSDGKLIVYPDIPNMHFKEGRFTSINCDGWEESPYGHTLNFNIKMPKSSRLKVGAINNGEVLVKNTKGSYIHANNINGGIELKNVTGQTNVHCINGEVNISYAVNPTQASTYYSLNGDITITYQNDLSADIAFKSMNGELFTDFNIAKQFAKTTKDESGKGNKAKFKYESRPVVQIGKGGMDFDFETLNGNVIIKKI